MRPTESLLHSQAAAPESPPVPDPARAVPWIATWIVLLSLAALLNAAMIYATGGTRGFFLPAIAALACVLAAFFDGFTGRIPNPLTYTAFLAGLALNLLAPLLAMLHANAAFTWLGAPGIQECLLGLAVCTALALVANLVAGIHGGDLKLLMALGTMLGLSATGGITLFALVIALVYSIVNLALVGRLNKVVRMGAQRALELLFFRRFHTPAPDHAVTAVTHIPMAIPLALGILVVLYLQVRHGIGGLW